jgi:hypothetical protein
MPWCDTTRCSPRRGLAKAEPAELTGRRATPALRSIDGLRLVRLRSPVHPELSHSVAIQRAHLTLETIMANEKGPNVKKKTKCKNCEGKGLVKKGDKVVKCQRCHGTGLR